MKYTEEEMKAVEDLRKTINYYNKRFEENEKITAVLVDNFDVENLFVLLNLVEKQQKEIDRLSFDNKILDCQLDSNGKNIDMLKNEILNNMISKEAIRNKIKDLESYIYTGKNAPQDFLQYRVKAKIQGYKELLGDE